MARLSLPGDIESVQLAKAISLVSLPGVGATVQDRSAVLLPGAVPIMSASILPLSAIQAQADRSGVINPASSMQIADRTVAGSVLVNGVNQSTDRAAATATQSGIIPAVDGQRIASQTLTAAGDRTATVQSTLPGDASVKIASSVVDTGRRDTTVSNLVEATKGSAVVLDNGLRAEGGSKAIETGKIFADKSEAILVDGKNVGGKVVINGGIDPVTGIVRFAGISGVEAAAAAAGRRAELTGFELELDEHGIPIKRSNDKLYFTGVEVAIAAILTVSGAARLRNEKQNAAADSIGASDAAVEFDANGNEINAQKVLHRRTHLVSHGDTLLSIADDLYQNQAVAWLIADLNTHNVKEERIDGKRVIELKSRQLLELPEAEEVTQFLAQLRRDFDAEQLITVVSESTVDRELINTFLGTVTGSTAEQSQISISLAAPMPAPVLAKTVTEKAAPMRLTDALPDLVIDMDFDDRFPVAVGISTAIKSLTHRVGKMIRRPIPTNKLRTV